MAGLRGKALFAWLLVCVFWGSTYLAIKIGVGVLPPFLFAGLRFGIAGAILLTGALAFGDTLPRRLEDWRTSAIVGVFLLAGGNAFVVWSEQYTPSGIASVFVVTVALWMAFFDAMIPGGTTRLTWRVVLGLAMGFIGTALLVGANPRAILSADLRGPILEEKAVDFILGKVSFEDKKMTLKALADAENAEEDAETSAKKPAKAKPAKSKSKKKAE